MKKIISVCSAMFMFIYLCITTVAGAVEFTPPFDINADSIYLVNLDTDTVIYQKNAELEQMPSTLVNIMVAAIVLEECENPDAVTITADSSLFAEFDEYEHPDDLRFCDIQNGDVLTVTGKISEINDTFKTVFVKGTITNQNGKKVCKANIQLGVRE